MQGVGAAFLLAATAATAGGQIAQGVAANQSASRQANLQEEQARIAKEEAERSAEQKGTERRKFLAEQRMAYLSSGVSLAGTPGIVAQDTFKEFQLEIDALRKSGVAQYRLGLMEAANTRLSGKAQLVSGLLTSVGTLGSGISKTMEFSTPAKK